MWRRISAPADGKRSTSHKGAPAIPSAQRHATEQEFGGSDPPALNRAMPLGDRHQAQVFPRTLSAAAGSTKARDNTTRPNVELTTRYCSVLGWMR